MASTYVNDLRLNEMATGDQSGSWGTVTNTNLELIGEAFSFGTEAITTNADTHTTTIADGASDAGRSMYLKYTGTLDSACTITIGPNTVSKMWFIENATSGSQNIIISQGSGANVTIAAGQTKAVYSDGAGAGAAFVDAFAALSVGALSSSGAVSGTNGTFSGAVSGASSSFGTITATSSIQLGDSVKAQFGASNDLQIFHDGSQSWIKDTGTGNLSLNGDNEVYIANAADDEYKARFITNGAVTLYYDNAAKIATASNGITVTGNVAADSISLNDNDVAYFGTSNDLQVYHDASNSWIKDTGTGNLKISAGNFEVVGAADTNKAFLYGIEGGSLYLYHNGNAKLQTTSTGVDITGTAVTDGVTVDGTLDIEEVRELVTVTASTSGTINFNLQNQGIIFANVNQLASRQINLQNPNTLLDAGQSVTCTLLFTNGSSAYYINGVQIDGQSVTPKWSGGSAPTEGNASSIDVYTFTIIKTANATFTVLASQTQFA